MCANSASPSARISWVCFRRGPGAPTRLTSAHVAPPGPRRVGPSRPAGGSLGSATWPRGHLANRLFWVVLAVCGAIGKMARTAKVRHLRACCFLAKREGATPTRLPSPASRRDASKAPNSPPVPGSLAVLPGRPEPRRCVTLRLTLLGAGSRASAGRKNRARRRVLSPPLGTHGRGSARSQANSTHGRSPPEAARAPP